MKLVLLHARALTLELLRYPAFLVPTLLFPAAFFVLFAVPGGRGDPAVEMARFAGFAAIGVAFFQFGVGIAVERASPWEAYLRTLPAGPATRIGARLASAAVFAAAAAAVVVAVALATTRPALAGPRWAEFGSTLLVGTAPFALFGIALGYWAPQRGALPIANVVYLGLSYAGGLWFRPSDLPATRSDGFSLVADALARGRAHGGCCRRSLRVRAIRAVGGVYGSLRHVCCVGVSARRTPAIPVMRNAPPNLSQKSHNRRAVA